jgi:hypothetical protein
MVEFSDAVFTTDVRMNGACFAPNRMFSHQTVWPQLTIRTHTHGRTHLTTTIAENFIEK